MKSNTRKPDLRAIALREMAEAGLVTEFGPEALREVESFTRAGGGIEAGGPVRDLRGLLWSSVDNEESRDLDQVEFVERLGGGRVRLLVGIADVDAYVPKGSAIDRHAFINTVSVYTPAVTFHLLPERLSTGMTSLLEGEDRLAVVTDLVLTAGGSVSSRDVYRAVVRNRAKLSYEEVGGWLEGIAERCNRMEGAARKVERRTRKAAVAVLLGGRVGETFEGIVTGVKEKGTFVQLVSPPAEGRVVKGEKGLSVGEKVRVRLISADPWLGYIDFANVTTGPGQGPRVGVRGGYLST